MVKMQLAHGLEKVEVAHDSSLFQLVHQYFSCRNARRIKVTVGSEDDSDRGT